MESSLQKDLTKGSVIKQLIVFALPFLLSNFIQALYNVADMIIVARFTGTAAASGVGQGGQITLLVTNAVLGLGLGGTVLLSQYFGAKNTQAVKETIGTLYTVFFIAALILTLLMVLLAGPILKLTKVAPEVFSDAKIYVQICMAGNIFVFGYNGVSAVLRGLGDSKSPLIFVSIACVINIFLDLLLIATFNMGTAGAAIATVVSQALSLLFSILYLIKKKFLFDFKLKSFKINKEKLKYIFIIGTPTAINNVIVNISFIALTFLINLIGGENAVYTSAASTMAGKFNGFAILPAIAISSAISSMSAQNIGAGQIDRAKKTMYTGLIFSIVLGAVMTLITMLFPDQIYKLFGADANVIEHGREYLRYFCFEYIAVAFTFSFMGLINGSGHTKTSMIISVCSSLLIRIPLAFLLGFTANLGMRGIGLAIPLATLGSAAIGAVYIAGGKWKKKKIGALFQSADLNESNSVIDSNS